MIRPATPADAAGICDIYNYYVLNTVITFEEEVVPVSEMEQRITQIIQKYPWLVCEENGKITGYAYAGAWKVRAAYRFSVECSVYLHPSSTGKGLGSELYQALFEPLKKMGVHGVIGGAALPNDASVHLHEKLGFEKVAHFKETGFKFGKWIDVGYWEKILG